VDLEKVEEALKTFLLPGAAPSGGSENGVRDEKGAREGNPLNESIN
jgi:hypothetical protein